MDDVFKIFPPWVSIAAYLLVIACFVYYSASKMREQFLGLHIAQQVIKDQLIKPGTEDDPRTLSIWKQLELLGSGQNLLMERINQADREFFNLRRVDSDLSEGVWEVKTAQIEMGQKIETIGKDTAEIKITLQRVANQEREP